MFPYNFLFEHRGEIWLEVIIKVIPVSTGHCPPLPPVLICSIFYRSRCLTTGDSGDTGSFLARKLESNNTTLIIALCSTTTTIPHPHRCGIGNQIECKMNLMRTTVIFASEFITGNDSFWFPSSARIDEVLHFANKSELSIKKIIRFLQGLSSERIIASRIISHCLWCRIIFEWRTKLIM